MPEITLTYFDIQGVAEKVRLAFVLGDIPFTDNRVKFDQWAAMKPTTPYGQLPVMSIDGGEPIAQSEAMLRYAGKLATENGVPLYPLVIVIVDFLLNFGSIFLERQVRHLNHYPKSSQL